MEGFAGLVPLESTIDVTVVATNSSSVPLDADSLPVYRIYSPAGFLVAGTLTLKDTGTITGATAASPTVYTSVGHKLSVGQKITITGVTVVSGSNGYNVTGTITAVTSNTFSIDVDNTLSGVYSSGGSWHAVGVYDFSYTPHVANNFQSGTVYSVYVFGLFSTVSTSIANFTFEVT